MISSHLGHWRVGCLKTQPRHLLDQPWIVHVNSDRTRNQMLPQGFTLRMYDDRVMGHGTLRVTQDERITTQSSPIATDHLPAPSVVLVEPWQSRSQHGRLEGVESRVASTRHGDAETLTPAILTQHSQSISQ